MILVIRIGIPTNASPSPKYDSGGTGGSTKSFSEASGDTFSCSVFGAGGSHVGLCVRIKHVANRESFNLGKKSHSTIPTQKV